MQLRVIQGGLSLPPGSPRPIVWNRLPIEARRTALVIRPDAHLVTLAYDDGRPFLVGIRDLDPARAPHVLETWIDTARAEGLQVRDERAA